MRPVTFAMLGLVASGAVFAADTKPHGPIGFGNIPFGSSSQDAVRLNHGNGQMIRDSDRPILTYRMSIQGLKFDVTQNYDQNGKAVDAIALSMLMDMPRDCIARFNHVLALLQGTYGQSGSTPLKSRVDEKNIKYSVLFQFNRNAGIEAEVTSADPNSGAPLAGGRAGGNRNSNGLGRCSIRLHYLPPGWTGNL